jgi:protein SCO1
MQRRTFFATAAASLSIGPATADVVRALGSGRRNIPNVPVTSHEDRTYQFYDDLVRGKTVLINMFYANCTGICPRMTSNLLKVQKALGSRVGREIFIYSISLKPEEDTPQRLAHYAGMHGIAADSGWLLLRARRRDMELLRARLGFKDSDPTLDANINEHTGMLRFGSDVYDKWGACPLLGRVETLVNAVLETDLTRPRHGF